MNELRYKLHMLHTTQLGERRIKENLDLDSDPVDFCRVLMAKEGAQAVRQGKNYYITCDGVEMTVNAGNMTLITAHRTGGRDFSPDGTDRAMECVIPGYREIYSEGAALVNAFLDSSLTWLDLSGYPGRMAHQAFKDCKTTDLTLCGVPAAAAEKLRNAFEGRPVSFDSRPVTDLDTEKRFDVITAILPGGCFGKEERERTVSACYPLLKDRGILIISERLAPFSQEGRNLYFNRWSAYQQSRGRSEVQVSEELKKAKGPGSALTVSEELKVLENCGFDSAEVFWLRGIQAGYAGIKERSSGL